MTKSSLGFRRLLVFAVAAALLAPPVFADKPSKCEGGRHKQNSHHHKRHDDYREYQPRAHQDRYERQYYFNDQHRGVFRAYYDDEFRHGSCPPGLAKKQNGCLPPGQAKRWELGRPLPRDVIFYDLPDRVIRQIGYPPAGYRFVRVASDILMIAIGSGMVVDALSDLNVLP